MKAKHQRLTLIGLAAIAVLAAVLLGMWGVRDAAAYFYSPSDVARKGLPLDQNVSIGGMVRKGSVQREGITTTFIVGDETPSTIPVRTTAALPDLFKENSGVVAEGRFQPDGLFVATEILAKHDENYMPPVVAGDKHETKSLQ